MNHTRPRVYVAAPYSNGDPIENVNRAIDMGERLFRLGYAPLIPILSHFWHQRHAHPWHEWIELDLAWLPSCDAVFRIAGESDGADLEEHKARELGIPVFTKVAELLSTIQPKTS